MSQLAMFLTLKSRNEKVGAIPVSTTADETCPDACPLKVTGCYAKNNHLGRLWRTLSNTTAGKKFNYSGNMLQSLTWEKFCHAVAAFEPNTLWRHNQAGDLPGENNKIDSRALRQLVKANHGKKGFTYTHKPVLGNKANARAIAHANANGFTINLSADNLTEADQLAALKIGPVVTLLPLTIQGNVDVQTPEGIRVVVCPATYRDDTTCDSCRLCQRRDRPCIVGFPAHGATRYAANNIASA